MATTGGRNGNGQSGTGRGRGNGSGGNGRGNGNGNGNGRRGPGGWTIAQRRRRARLKKRGVQGLLIIGGLGAIGILSVFIFTVLATIQVGTSVYSAVSQDLPSVSEINNRQTFKTAQIYDRKGTLLYEFFAPDGGMRTVVPLSEISQQLIDATLAAEDANFYSNPGFDVRGILRAFVQNLQADETVSGASTITQQLVRGVLLDPNEAAQRSMSRKVREALLAYQVTERYSKGQILQLYLNEIYYGNLAYGVEAASLTYFNKRARDLTLAEAALIAGLPQAPATYDPYKNPSAAKERQLYVLEQMARHGFVGEAEAEAARRERLNYTPLKRDLLAPHWVMYIRDQVEAKYGPRLLYQGGLKIFTTLDLDLQGKLEEVARNNKDTLAVRDGNNTAIMALNPKTGEVLAMVGSMDYYDKEIDGQVNVTVAHPGRQPGSSIKPLIYLAAFARDYHPATVIDDVAVTYRDAVGTVWQPKNFDNKFHGKVTARTALGNSLNIPAVKTLEHIGIEGAVELVRKLGISTWTDRSRLGLSLSLGGAEVLPLELTGAYATLANNGRRIPPVAITKLVDAEGNVLEDYKVPQGEQVADPRAAYMVTSILTDNNARLVTYGPNSMLKTPYPSAVKTGTTDNYRDTWTMGYTPSVVVGVWVGNTDGHPMKEVLSSMSAGKIWREAMDTTVAYLNLPAEQFPRPSGLAEAEICGDTAMRPGQPQCYKELFKIEQAPNQARTYLPGSIRPAAQTTPTAEGTPTPQETPAPQGTPAPALTPGAPAQPPQPTGAPAQPKPGQPRSGQPTAAPKPQATQRPAPTPRPREVQPTQAPRREAPKPPGR
jgi:1A family penicillin-binding protein